MTIADSIMESRIKVLLPSHHYDRYVSMIWEIGTHTIEQH